MTSTGYCYHTKDTAASTTSPAKAQAMQRDRDFRSLSNAYLKALITERGYSHDGLLTREELVERAEEAAATPYLPRLEGDGDGIDSEEEQTEEAEALAQRLVLQELRAIVAVRDAVACSVGDVLKLVRARAPEEYRIVGKSWVRDRLRETMEAVDDEEEDPPHAQYVRNIGASGSRLSFRFAPMYIDAAGNETTRILLDKGGAVGSAASGAHEADGEAPGDAAPGDVDEEYMYSAAEFEFHIKPKANEEPTVVIVKKSGQMGEPPNLPEQVLDLYDDLSVTCGDTGRSYQRGDFIAPRYGRKVPRIFAGVLLLDISVSGCSELLGAEDTLTGRSNKSVLVLVFEPATEKLEIQSYDWNYGLGKTEPPEQNPRSRYFQNIEARLRATMARVFLKRDDTLRKLIRKGQLFEVKSVISYKEVKGTALVTVNWVGYPPEHCTTEEVANIQDSLTKAQLNMLSELRSQYVSSLKQTNLDRTFPEHAKRQNILDAPSNAELVADMQTMTKMNKDLRQLVKKMGDESKLLEDEVKELRSQLEKANAAKDTAIKQKSAAQNQKNAANRKVKGLTDTATDLEETVENLQGVISSMQEDCQEKDNLIAQQAAQLGDKAAQLKKQAKKRKKENDSSSDDSSSDDDPIATAYANAMNKNKKRNKNKKKKKKKKKEKRLYRHSDGGHPYLNVSRATDMYSIQRSTPLPHATTY